MVLRSIRVLTNCHSLRSKPYRKTVRDNHDESIYTQVRRRFRTRLAKSVTNYLKKIWKVNNELKSLEISILTRARLFRQQECDLCARQRFETHFAKLLKDSGRSTKFRTANSSNQVVFNHTLILLTARWFVKREARVPISFVTFVIRRNV